MSRRRTVHSAWVGWEILHIRTHAERWHEHLLHLLLLPLQPWLYSDEKRAKTQHVLGETDEEPALPDWQYKMYSVWWITMSLVQNEKGNCNWWLDHAPSLISGHLMNLRLVAPHFEKQLLSSANAVLTHILLKSWEMQSKSWTETRPWRKK